MSLTPQVVEPVSTHPHGSLAALTNTEIQKSATVRTVGEKLDKVNTEFRLAVIALKLEMDANDSGTQGGHNNESRFWKSTREGQHGPYLQEMVENGNRRTVQRWLTYEKAATELLEFCVARATQDAEPTSQLATVEALDRGLSFSALESFSSLPQEAKPAARLMLQERDKVSQHDIEQIGKLYRNYPELDIKLCEGITSGDITKQKDIELLMEREREARIKAESDRDRAIGEADAARRALEQANNLQQAEAEEDRLAEVAKTKPVPSSAPKTVAEKAAALVERKAPPRSYFESDAGKAKVTEIIGALPDGLGSLLTTLNTLEKELNTQFDHVESHADIRSFMGGYDRYFYSPSAAARKWGKGGRLDRMEKLRSKLLYLSGRIENYIRATTPDKETIYPE